jgi:hypothetical protein
VLVVEMDVVEEYIVVARVVVRGGATGCGWWLIRVVDGCEWGCGQGEIVKCGEE